MMEVGVWMIFKCVSNNTIPDGIEANRNQETPEQGAPTNYRLIQQGVRHVSHPHAIEQAVKVSAAK